MTELSETFGAATPAAFNTVSERTEIERLAYSYWEARGGQDGSPEEDWLRAEQEFRARR
ncbi:MAG TPA: DUF2934 domain-containing protein [Bryobacteraceae bacterium]|nr:DUF2934 domain-containing protein [Bryobacteraceae bacterium]